MALKKTLAAGVPMAKVIFGQDPKLGMILLPIMLYHPIQIFYCAVLANKYAKVDLEAGEVKSGRAFGLWLLGRSRITSIEVSGMTMI